jgi:hypothetical protein
MDDLMDEQKADVLELFKCDINRTFYQDQESQCAKDLIDEENCSIGMLLHFVIIEYVDAHGCS